VGRLVKPRRIVNPPLAWYNVGRTASPPQDAILPHLIAARAANPQRRRPWSRGTHSRLVS